MNRIMRTLTIKNRLMAIATCVLCALCANAYDFYVDSVYYNITSSTTVEVTSKVNRVASYSGDVVIPETVTYDDVTYTVTGIGYEAFRPSPITSIQLPTTLQYIGKGAFDRCGQITEIHVPESVTSIGTWAFYDCKKLVSVNIPEGVTGIGELTFGNCNILPSITLPESLQTIGAEAFAYCHGLRTIFIPKNVQQIHAQAFSYCEHLNAYTVDSENPYFDSRDNCNAIIETATNKLVAGGAQTVVPDGIKTIGAYAFSYRHDLDTLYLPNSVKTIGSYAFASCGIHKMNIPDSLEAIGGYAFTYANFKNVVLPNTVTSIGSNAFQRCQQMTSIVLSENLQTIPYELFADCLSLKEVIIPNSVTSINYGAFEWCSSLEHVFIPNSVTSIGSMIFRFCRELKCIEVEEGNPVFDSRENCNAVIETATNKLRFGCGTTVIPSSVDTIGVSSFYGMSKMRSIDIPNTVNYIEKSAFGVAISLSRFTSVTQSP